MKSREKKRLACPWFFFLLFFRSTPVMNDELEALASLGFSCIERGRSASCCGSDSDDSTGPMEGLDLVRLVELAPALACA